LNTLIPVIPDIIGASVGLRGADDQNANRAASTQRWAGWDEYRTEQKRATDLLERLDGLANGAVGAVGAAGSTGGRPKLTPDEVSEQFGDTSSPWPTAANQ